MKMTKNSLFKELEIIDETTIKRVSEVIKNQDDVTGRGEYGETCLHLLCSPEHANKARYLVPLAYILTDSGIDIDCQDQEGNTVLHVCAINDCDPSLVLAFLRLGADCTLVNRYKLKAAECGDGNKASELISRYSPGLYGLVKQGQEDKVKHMIQHWFHIDRKLQGEKLEKMAKKNKHMSLYELIKANKARSGLIRAVYTGNAEKVKKLEEDVNDVDIYDESNQRKWPLIAEAMSLGYTDVVKVLLKRSNKNQEVETDSQQVMPLFQYILQSVKGPTSTFIKTLLKKADLSLYPGQPIAQLYDFWKKGFPDQIVHSYVKSGNFTLASRMPTGLTLRDIILLEIYKDRSNLHKHLSFVDNVVMKLVKEGEVAAIKKLAVLSYTGLLVRNEKGRSTLQTAQKSGSENTVDILQKVPSLLVSS